MEDYKKRLADILAETGALFFDKGLVLKDGRPSPYFVNFGMFRTGRLSMELGSFFADMIKSNGLADKTDIILGPSYKGSAIALATSIALYSRHGYDLFFEYDRKEEKTHGEGSRKGSIMVNRTLFDGCRVFIVDDVATSMGTKVELLDRLKREAESDNITVKVTGIGIAVDREQTSAVYDQQGKIILNKKGANAIKDFVAKTGIPVYPVAGIKEIIIYLHEDEVPVLINGERRPIDDEIRTLFEEYLKTYGNNPL
jgi:orotate phosphoribosyltransferase